MGNENRKGLAALNGLASNFFNHLVPHVVTTRSFKILSDIVFAGLGIRTVVQFRIERDWVKHCQNVLANDSEPNEDYLLSPVEIINKLKNTREVPSDIAFVICDEAMLLVGKEEIRDEVRSRCGVTLVWLSDILTPSELSSFSTLEQSVINFEIAVRAPYFVGLSRSSAANLVLMEAFARNRRSITTHYIYNLPGDVLGRRMDNGAEIKPSLVVNKLQARECLIPPSDEDCRWPAVLTAHIGGFGDLVSDGCPIPGVRGGPLVCGVRNNQDGYLIEGFHLAVGPASPVGVEYRILQDDGSWTPWVESGGYVGTREQHRAICGYSVRLIGPLSKRFRCVCAGSFVGYPDLVVVQDGEACCAPDSAKLEAMQIVFRPDTTDWSGLMRIETEKDTVLGLASKIARLREQTWH
jgi:hypothetical protein